MVDHFYLTLPSDSSCLYYPNNTTARYITKLPERIHLDGDYEVGLSELVYPRNWYNVDNKEGIYWIGALDIATNSLDKMYMKSGYYRNGDEFASSLTHQATRTFADVSAKFTFIEHVSRIRIQIQNSSKHKVVISRKLMEFLGFHEKWSAADLVGTDAFDPNR